MPSCFLYNRIQRYGCMWMGRHDFGGVEGGLAVTVSIGLACTDMGFVSSKDLLNGADKALYSAKGEGRNRVCLYGPEVRELG